ncbi:bifunctional isocitrate dehydrogenase kinase/pho sphatase [Desulfonema ishimotonii]|uniref:Bifunctional isocitrate dehydrogenase kinase/pho sphatase n=1 Tax=Desulfonema ishimotonii TaxID=45657 RepID=A0A401FX17_9BACT|nr:bifunctional isocitrate dehydrogenase kinase/phosphatase [Desulfonema ishimotonii]GBC61505.1 bifunctional isocitrate dehydrogenase kinase/pho sphatase [Desulfonema ishimotonii]
MKKTMKIDNAATCAAEHIRDAFDTYQAKFLEITRRSGDRFNQRDWQGVHQDALERLDLYTETVNRTVAALRCENGDPPDLTGAGPAMKQVYAALIAGRTDFELTETFYNSVVRRLSGTVGVNPAAEFIAADFKIPRIEDRACPVCRFYPQPPAPWTPRDLIREIISAYGSEFEFQDMERDIRRVTEALENHMANRIGTRQINGAEMIEPVFYRDRAAYIIGRLRIGHRIFPMVIALLSEPEGVMVDAVLLTGREISILFSFTRSYFHAEVSNPSEMVNFLKTIIPLKRVSEIYTSVGFHKHGKAELFRELTRSLAASDDQFEIAKGEKGMVMLVFTLPSFNVVFKIIRDRFEYPKNTSRDAVRNRYQLVFRHDRAGRLVDAQEFEYLEFGRARFSDGLLAEFRRMARNSVIIKADRVIIRHLYAERRLTPLDIYVRESVTEAAREAVIDYGRAIKELAASNIFPGDLFLKNFGVTRHGRVVFYDYDELMLLTECNFRKFPKSRSYEDELSSEPWFHVGDQDVFPEEFRTFIRFPDHLKAVFESAHGDLFDVKFWQTTQAHLNAGKVIHIFPYGQARRFEHRSV